MAKCLNTEINNNVVLHGAQMDEKTTGSILNALGVKGIEENPIIKAIIKGKDGQTNCNIEQAVLLFVLLSKGKIEDKI